MSLCAFPSFSFGIPMPSVSLDIPFPDLSFSLPFPLPIYCPLD